MLLSKSSSIFTSYLIQNNLKLSKMKNVEINTATPKQINEFKNSIIELGYSNEQAEKLILSAKKNNDTISVKA